MDAYRRDLAMVAELLIDPVDKTVTDMELEDINLAGLRHAFAIRAELSSAATMARTHSVWSRLYRFLRTEGLVTVNLLEKIERAKVGTARPRSIEHTDLAQRLLAAAATEPDGRVSTRWPTRDSALVACLMTTGARLSELIALNCGSVTGEQGAYQLDVVGKGSKHRSIPLVDDLATRLGRYQTERHHRSPHTASTGLPLPSSSTPPPGSGSPPPSAIPYGPPG